MSLLKIDEIFPRHIMWFMFGMISNGLLIKYSWWALLSLPVWFIIDLTILKLENYKPKQRKIDDFDEVLR